MPQQNPDRPAIFARRRLLASSMACAVWPGVAGAQTGEPAARIEALHAAMLETMKQARQLGPRGRYDKLAPVIARNFDIAAMIRVASGPAWDQASAAQRAALTEAFARVTAATYASRLSGWSGEKFETIGTIDQPPADKRVRTRMVPASGDVVDIDYLMRNTVEGWRIADVYLDGSISELAIRRNEYAAIARSGGPDALVAALTKKSEQLLGGS